VGVGDWAREKRDELVRLFRHEVVLPPTDNDILVAPASINLVIVSDFQMPPFNNLPIVIEDERYGKVTFNMVQQPTLGNDGTAGLPEYLVEGSERDAKTEQSALRTEDLAVTFGTDVVVDLKCTPSEYNAIIGNATRCSGNVSQNENNYRQCKNLRVKPIDAERVYCHIHEGQQQQQQQQQTDKLSE
jgi:hypothetical protein